jgi:60 kDa SS-A/Ro ribonucleoprotein
MTFSYSSVYNPNVSPQTEKTKSNQVENSAGGFVFQVDDFVRLQRFLILGSEGGSYYASERKLTRDNATCVERCLKCDPIRSVEMIVDVSENGRAPKNDPAIFALALAVATPESARLASQYIPRVCRTGTHLFQFVEAAAKFRGWGSHLRRGVSAWYEGKTDQQLVYQLAKYQQRNGMTHARVMRRAHPKLGNNAIARWALAADQGERKVSDARSYVATLGLPEYLQAFEELKTADEKQTVALILKHKFTHEMVATMHRGSPAVWEALLPTMPLGALIRNLGKLSSVGLTKPMGQSEKLIAEKLTDSALLKAARVHPIGILSAQRVYAQGHGEKGSLKWDPSRVVFDALDEAFYLAFGSIEPTGKRTLLALDVSGSMATGQIADLNITPREASAALAMVTARTEQQWFCHGFSNTFVPLLISPKMRLPEVITKISNLPFRSTDCSLPMVWAKQNGIDFDVCHIYTDSETYAGAIHPFRALKQYRQARGINAKVAVIGMLANEFTIADPSDAGMLDVVGCDTATPNLLADFAKW